MIVNNNKTINPQQASDSVQQIYPARSKKINKVTLVKSEQGGMSDQSGNVFVPAADTAYDRTVRYHEALHVDFTPKKFAPKDALDQGLEDARLHRHCSKSSEIRSVRRDELATALKDVRKSIKLAERGQITAITSVVILRATAILGNEPKHAKLLNQAANLIAPDYLAKINQVMELINTTPNSKDWSKARTILHEYFSKEFKPQPPAPAPPQQSEQKHNQNKQDEQSELPDVPQPRDEERSDSDKAEKSESESEETDESESEKIDKLKPEKTDKSESEESDESESEESESETGIADEYDNGFDSDNSGELETESESGGSKGEDFSDVISVETVTKPKKVKLHPSAYRGSSISHHDPNPEYAAKLHQRFPKQLLIHRLDTGSDSVPTIQGNRGKVNSLSGSRINSGRLAMAVNNNVRVFNHRRGEGGGAILIDNSGSMFIPEQVLINFAASLPLATIAFYSAKGDTDRIKEGHLSVYAANGRRAGKHSITVYGGSGNLVDYQAISWLLDQPGPRWYIGDLHFTGSWSRHCDDFFQTAVNRKLVTHVRTLQQMTELLKRTKK